MEDHYDHELQVGFPKYAKKISSTGMDQIYGSLLLCQSLYIYTKMITYSHLITEDPMKQKT